MLKATLSLSKGRGRAVRAAAASPRIRLSQNYPGLDLRRSIRYAIEAVATSSGASGPVTTL